MNCEIIKLLRGILVMAVGMSAQAFHTKCEVFEINLVKEQYIRLPGPHHFQNLTNNLGDMIRQPNSRLLGIN